MILEQVKPFAPRTEPAWRHYVRNVLLAILNAGLVGLVWRGGVVAAGAWAQASGIGLLPWLGLPRGWSVAITVLVFDALSYAMHVAYHVFPPMWRLHQVHHTDLDFDVTTASRFHPGEILLSTAVQTALAVALGAPPEGIVAFQMLLLLQAQAQHSNLALPEHMDRIVRALFVTPNYHRIHHSIVMAETNSNYSTVFSVWDRLGRTLCNRSQAGIRIGLGQFRDRNELVLIKLLALPFRRLRAPGTAVE
jgi:sterol desaturase/sphingolipid hydroxylase (fatty acid hydroxylase superfamily)